MSALKPVITCKLTARDNETKNPDHLQTLAEQIIAEKTGTTAKKVATIPALSIKIPSISPRNENEVEICTTVRSDFRNKINTRIHHLSWDSVKISVPRKCSICNKTGHNRRKCPLNMYNSMPPK